MSHVGTDDSAHAERGGWLVARPLPLLVALDASGIGLATAAVAQLGHPDLLLHVVWIALAIEAFAFGLRIATVRIAAATIFVVLYGLAANGDATPMAHAMKDLDFEEWPLMAVIAVIVAVMADRVTTTGRRYAALYRAASDRLLTAQEDERRHLAADLHDGVGQTMTALALTLDAAAAALRNPDGSDTAGGDAVGRAREMAGVALEEVRGVAFRLRPARLHETGLAAALRELAASAGMPVELSASTALFRPGLLDPDAEVDAYRIVQEALGNAMRHGKAERVRISVRRVDHLLRIEVADDGVGFDVRNVRGRGLGLASMRDRAAAIRGTLHVRSRPGAGTVVRIDVPLAGDALAVVASVGGEATGLVPAGLEAPR